MFLCDLARDLHMSVAEITHGRGTPMSAQEMGVMWPMYYRFSNLEQRDVAREQEKDKP